MKRNAFTRLLCTLLCAAMLFGAVALPARAMPPIVDTPASVQKVDPNPSIFRRIFDALFINFGLIGFIYDPYQGTIINQRPVFQYLLGFNDIYDMFTWVVNVWADAMICEFNYGGKDWRVQFWKGGYGVFLCTGGEIGFYNKPENMPGEHYVCAPQGDWLNLRYTMFNKGKELYTRPSPYLTDDTGPYWWCPGYKLLSICTDFYSSPRANVVMDAVIEFKDNDMAKQFMATLKAKGFVQKKTGELGLDTPETYQLQTDKKSVRMVWQNINEGLY